MDEGGDVCIAFVFKGISPFVTSSIDRVSDEDKVNLIGRRQTLEHIIVSNINKRLALESILADCQHGFRSQRSCETQLVQFHHDLVSNLDRAVSRCHRQTDVIVMDFLFSLMIFWIISGHLFGYLLMIVFYTGISSGHWIVRFCKMT